MLPRYCIILCLSAIGQIAFSQVPDLERDILPFMEKHCFDCHDDGEDSKGNVDLGAAYEDANLHSKTWLKALRSIEFHDMPPATRKQQPATLEREMFIHWANHQLSKPDPKFGQINPGAPVLRRLTRLEYNNTVRDLLGLHTDVFMFTERLPLNSHEFYQPQSGTMPAALNVRVRELGQKYDVLLRHSGLPGDSKAEHGYSNQGDVLNLTPLLLEKYVTLAQEIAFHPDLLTRAEKLQELFPNANSQKSATSTSRKPNRIVNVTGKIAPNGNVQKEASQNAFSLKQFQSDLELAYKEDRGGIYNVSNSGTVAGKGGLIQLAYGQSGGRLIKVNPNADLWEVSFATAEESSGGLLFTNKNKGEKVFELTFQLDQKIPGSGIAQLGIVVLGRRNQTGSVSLTAKFSDGSSTQLLVDLPTGTSSDNTFVCFQAPKNQTIRKLELDGSKFSGDYVLFDDLGFITRDQASTNQLVGVELPKDEVTPVPKKKAPFTVDPTLAKKPLKIRLKKILSRAFRRPPTSEEIDLYEKVYQQSIHSGQSEELALRNTLRAILCSPNFLYRAETLTTGEPVVRKLNNHELATRLSYFFWASMPDDALLQAAAQSSPWTDSDISKHVIRMIKDPKSRELAEAFAFQWLQLNELFGSKPDNRRSRDYYGGPQGKYNMGGEMIAETLLLFETILVENRNILELLDANYAYLNPRLIKHYRLSSHFERELQSLQKRDRNGKIVDDNGTFIRVKLPNRKRGGVFTSGATLTLTSLPLRTSPVYRGAWMTEVLFNRPPPPPPAMVDELGEDDQKFEEAGLTLRQKLEDHRSKTACMGCHGRIDPLGFALENYDPIGRWRDNYSKSPVDSSGELFANRPYNGPIEFKDALLLRKEDFVHAFIEHLMTYALGRHLQPYDQATIRQLVQQSKENDYRFQDLLVAIATSWPFRNTISD